MTDEAGTADVSVAALLEHTRDLIVAAWDRGERPSYLRVHPDVFRAVSRIKERETAYGRPPRVLGLLVVRADDVGLRGAEVS